MLGGKDGQTLFHRILPATARGLTSTTSVDWHLKVKNKTCNVGLTKNYCIKVSMQKISSINKLIQQILGSHELHDHAHFWPGPPKSHWNNFLFSWICTTMQKIIFWPTFNLCEFASTCKKSGYFIDLFWRYGWLKNPAIWLAENILVHISGTRISPNMGFVQEHSK